MRYTVHAERHRLTIEFRVGTTIEAISKAWKLMGDGATGVYIYDDELDSAYWPDQFAELVQESRQSLGIPRHEAPDAPLESSYSNGPAAQ
jgi:hypothetical protein